MERNGAQFVGEHFLLVEAGLELGSLVNKLRDHQCQAAVWLEQGQWKRLSAEVLPQILLQGGEGLRESANTVGASLKTLPMGTPLDEIRQGLEQEGWVGLTCDGQLVELVNWASWVRHAARHRLGMATSFSPEAARNDQPVSSRR